MTIEEFIAQRLDEEQAVAESSVGGPARLEKTWQSVMWDDNGAYLTTVADTNNVFLAPEIGRASDHIALHDPARVLRQVVALRHAVNVIRVGNIYSNGYSVSEANLSIDLRPIAAIWADHPDFQQEWAQ